MIKVGILTYDKPHLKTQQVINGLLKKKNISIKKIIFSKFKVFKERKIFFRHRPYQFIGKHPAEIANSLNIKFENINNNNSFSNLDYIIICGSQIIKKKIKKKFIINCHSGLIPQSRGLDSFKWDILRGKKLGTTLHFIDKKVDFGEIISHKYTKIYKSDSLKTAANKHYNSEIEMLINFDIFLKKKKIFKLSVNKNTLRMNLNYEKKMIKYFKERNKLSSINEKI